MKTVTLGEAIELAKELVRSLRPEDQTPEAVKRLADAIEDELLSEKLRRKRENLKGWEEVA